MILDTFGLGNDCLSAALAYADKRWRVLPLHTVSDGRCSCGVADCNPGKHPLGLIVPHGAHDATADPARLRAWWFAHPRANVGIATGKDSGVFVVGPDGQTGIDALDSLARARGGLPRTVTARTPDGKHLYFRWPAGLRGR